MTVLHAGTEFGHVCPGSEIATKIPGSQGCQEPSIQFAHYSQEPTGIGMASSATFTLTFTSTPARSVSGFLIFSADMTEVEVDITGTVRPLSLLHSNKSYLRVAETF